MPIAKQRIIDVLKQVVPDEDAEKIVFYLRGKTSISEFIVAEELDLEIHRTRNLLYKLLDLNLVEFKRKKDKIKGWYICYWDFNEVAVPHLEEKLDKENIIKLQERLDKEQNSFFYMCRFAHVRQNFEIAFENNFKCPECGEIMNQLDNSRTIAFLEEKIAAIKQKQQPVEKKPATKKAATKKVATKKTAVSKKATAKKRSRAST